MTMYSIGDRVYDDDDDDDYTMLTINYIHDICTRCCYWNCLELSGILSSNINCLFLTPLSALHFLQ